MDKVCHGKSKWGQNKDTIMSYGSEKGNESFAKQKTASISEPRIQSSSSKLMKKSTISDEFNKDSIQESEKVNL